MADHVIGFVTGGVSKVIAIGSELAAGEKGKASAEARRQRQADQQQSADRRRSSVDSNDSIEQNDTEYQWALEELEEELGAPPAYQQHEQQRSLQYQSDLPQQRLSQHVMIPQRRPGSRQRGFMRAYAPVLGPAGVDQDSFLKFLNDLDKATAASPVVSPSLPRADHPMLISQPQFDVMNLACLIMGFIPDPICFAVSTAVGTASQFAQECQIRYRSNAFLDNANETIFKPRGLYAMVMTWKPDQPDDLVMTVDSTDPTQKALVHDVTASSTRQFLRRLRDSSGKATDSQMPECAELIHPGLDLALTTQAMTEDNVLKRKASIVNEYLDRRSQGDFAVKNPNSKYAAALPAQSKDTYVNRFANPDHRVNNGSIFSLLSGGSVDPIGAGRVRRAEKKAKRKGEPVLSEQERHDAFMGRKVRGRVTGTPSKSIPIVGKMLKKDVLYLFVTNLPSEEEVRALDEKLKGRGNPS